MALPVKPCLSCQKLMWVKSEMIQWLDEQTLRFSCPHCGVIVRQTLVDVGDNAAGPIKPS